MNKALVGNIRSAAVRQAAEEIFEFIPADSRPSMQTVRFALLAIADRIIRDTYEDLSNEAERDSVDL